MANWRSRGAQRRDPRGLLGDVAARALSRVLLADEGRAARLARLNGSVIEIRLRDSGLCWQFRPGSHGVTFGAGEFEQVDVTIVGRAADFIAFARASRRGDAFAAGRLEMSGDLAVAQQVQGLLGEMDIDWADLLAPALGDVAAHNVGRLLDRCAGFARDRARRFEADVADWLRHEADLTPTRAEVESQARAIFTTADDVERLAARLRRLERAWPPR